MAEKRRNFDYLSVSYSTLTKPKTKYPEELMKHITSLIGLKGGKAVDVGCGRGDQLHALRQLGFEVSGLDIECAAELTGDHSVCDVGSETFPISSNSVDLAFSKAVIEHLYLPQIEHFMSELRRITKPGGYIVLMTPDWQYMYREFYTEFTHVSPFTAPSLEQCMKMHGFIDVHVESFIQLPSVWKRPGLRWVCDMLCYLPIPSSAGKWIRWSRERVLLAIGKKG